MSVKPCPVASCHRIAKPEHLMCWPCWRRVPKLLQRAVWDTFSEMGRRHGAEGVEAVHAYRKAADAAIKAVEAKNA